MSQIKVITGKSCVYATQYKTIVYKAFFENDDQLRDAQISAQAAAFRYACYETKAVCDIVDNFLIEDNDDVFAYLEKCHSLINYPAIS